MLFVWCMSVSHPIFRERLVDNKVIKELIHKCRIARCRSRFIVPVILFENKVCWYTSVNPYFIILLGTSILFSTWYPLKKTCIMQNLPTKYFKWIWTLPSADFSVTIFSNLKDLYREHTSNVFLYSIFIYMINVSSVNNYK